MALAMLAVLVGLAWLPRPRPQAGPASPAAHAAEASEPRSAAAAALPIASLAPVTAIGSPSTAEREAVKPADAARVPELRVRERVCELIAHLVSPDGKELLVPIATLDLVDQAGNRRQATVRSASSVSIPDLAPGAWTVDARAPGFVHRTQVVQLPWVDPSEWCMNPGSTPNTVNERLVLWPEDWIPVVVRTPRGRAFRELALDLEIEPKQLFVGAFDVVTRHSAPDSGASDDAHPPAIFVRPPGYNAWELPGGAIGSLRLRRAPPFWAGLRVLGEPLDWRLVQPGDVEVAFELSLGAFDERCARLRLRVVDALSGAPLPEAKVTLRADTAAHRRGDQNGVHPGPDGIVELRRILPGRYELAVELGEAQHQQRLALEAREVRDLGDVALQQGPPIELLVLDGDGEPAQAWVEIAPYIPGRRVDELFPPMLHRQSGADGKYRLARPAVRSIVRARVEGSTSMGQPSRGARTENVLLDPNRLPGAPLMLRLRDPILVSFEIAGTHRLEIADELDVVVAWSPLHRQRADHGLTFSVHGQGSSRPEVIRGNRELLPGRYTARFLDDAGEVTRETTFTVGSRPTSVSGP